MYSKIIFTALAAFCIHTTALAQKLPKKQEASISIPSNYKINGKADEWNNQYQAYNSATLLNYTVANNEKDLYIIVNAANGTIVDKIATFGITLTLSPASNPDDKVTLTYPLIKIEKLMPLPSKTMTDSLLAVSNGKFNAMAKTMKITGVKDITEAETSIYNTYDVRVAGAVDLQRAFTCEFAIPLKYIGINLKSGELIKFDIRLNGPTEPRWRDYTITQSGNGKYVTLTSPDGRSVVEMVADFYAAQTEPFNFSGEYKLK